MKRFPPPPRPPAATTTRAVSQVSSLRTVQEIVAEVLGIPVARVKPESFFVADLGCDNLDAAEIAVELEDRFGIRVLEEGVAIKVLSEEFVWHTATVAEAAAYIDAVIKKN